MEMLEEAGKLGMRSQLIRPFSLLGIPSELRQAV
jgi:hypothetical protein